MAGSGSIPPIPEQMNNLNVKSKCSCSKCDSYVCFTKRRIADPCSCSKCLNSKTCLNFPNKDSNSNLRKTEKLRKAKTEQALMEGDEITAKERLKREITYDFDEVLKISSVAKYKPQFSIDKDGIVTKKENNKEAARKVESVVINISRKKHTSSAVKINGQVINLPSMEVHDDLKQESKISAYKISPYDVLKRISDAYKACSCIVCECIVGKSLPTKRKICQCEPCDCKDCTNVLTKFQYLEGPEHDPPICCPCVRCDRGSCKGIVNRFDQPQICDCPPCNCVKCIETNEKPCNCEPCQCVECKTMQHTIPHVKRNFIVAPVGEQRQRLCNCSPCECVECTGHGMPSSFMREAATNVSRHPRCRCNMCANEACVADGNQACKCEGRRIIAKPVEKDVHDYDIRAIVTDGKVMYTNSRPLRNNTIAMYANIPNIYQTRFQRECSCDLCECLICNCKESAVDSIKSSKVFKDSLKVQYVSNCMHNVSQNACKCQTCECQVCSNRVGSKNVLTAQKTCKCDVCDCLNCTDKIKEDIKLHSCVNIFNEYSTIKRSCKCNPCECVKCSTSITCAGDVCHCAKCICEQCIHESKVSIYPIKKAEVFTPRSFSKEIENKNTNKYHAEFLARHNHQSETDIKLYNSQGKISQQKDSVTHYGCPQNYHLTNKIVYIPSGKENKMHSTSENIKYTIVNNDSERNETKNMYRDVWEKNYLNSKTKESAESVSANVDRVIEGDPHANSCDSGCVSFDHFTLFPKSPALIQRHRKDNLKYDYAYADQDEEEKANVAERLDNSSDVSVCNEIVGRHHHSFESDKKYDSSRDNINNEYSNTHSRKYNDKQMYGHQYWIKNVDVSVTVLDQMHDSNERLSLIEGSRYGSTEYTNTIQESDENLPHLRNIRDHSRSSRSKRLEDLFNNDTYYEGVQRTLHRARAFSSQLMEILAKYERANNEFQSITEKLKISHATLLAENTSDKSKDDNNNVGISAQQLDLKTEHKTNSTLKHKNITQEKTTKRSVSIDMPTKDIEERCESLNSSPISNFSNATELGIDTYEYFEDMCNINKTKTSKRNKNDFTMFCDRKIGVKRGVKKLNKPRILKQVIIISRDAQSPGTSNRVIKTAISTQTLTQKLGKVAAGVDSLSRIYISSEVENVPTKRSVEVMPISKKSFSLKTVPEKRNKGVCVVPTLQAEVKQAVRSISMQTKILNNENVPRRNVALQNLQVEVQKLLDLPLLKKENYYKEHHTYLAQGNSDDFTSFLNATHYQINKENYETSNVFIRKAADCKSSKSCCDALKVNFLGLRRISDHTVLVKWTAPRVTSDVTGYELLVDGKAVQKILSPSRCVAVITCLPHCETVLLTIRTITPLTPSGHFPSSTVVYHPRVK